MEAARIEMLARGEILECEEEENQEPLTEQLLIRDQSSSKLPSDLLLTNVIDLNWRDPKRSRLLGKTFKPTLHHRDVPKPPPLTGDEFGMVRGQL